MSTKNHLTTTLMVILSIALFSCSNENEEDLMPTDERCEEQPATLSGDIVPIINQNCAISGCHVSGTNRVNLSLAENIISNANLIKDYTESGYMPLQASGIELSEEEKDFIYCWVSEGALDN